MLTRVCFRCTYPLRCLSRGSGPSYGTWYTYGRDGASPQVLWSLIKSYPKFPVQTSKIARGERPVVHHLASYQQGYVLREYILRRPTRSRYIFRIGIRLRADMYASPCTAESSSPVWPSSDTGPYCTNPPVTSSQVLESSYWIALGALLPGSLSCQCCSVKSLSGIFYAGDDSERLNQE